MVGSGPPPQNTPPPPQRRRGQPGAVRACIDPPPPEEETTGRSGVWTISSSSPPPAPHVGGPKWVQGGPPAQHQPRGHTLPSAPKTMECTEYVESDAPDQGGGLGSRPEPHHEPSPKRVHAGDQEACPVPTEAGAGCASFARPVGHREDRDRGWPLLTPPPPTPTLLPEALESGPRQEIHSAAGSGRCPQSPPPGGSTSHPRCTP